MVNSSTASNFIFNIGSIKSIHHLRTAIKHNKREIQAELGAKSYIDINRIRENYSIIPSISVTDIIQKIKHSIFEYEADSSTKRNFDQLRLRWLRMFSIQGFLTCRSTLLVTYKNLSQVLEGSCIYRVLTTRIPPLMIRIAGDRLARFAGRNWRELE